MGCNYPYLSVVIEGDFACFTNPQYKVERVSYPIITPSAARGILEAIFWKPEFYWRVREIHLLSEIRYFSILRNEVKSVATTKPIYIEEDRSQRHTLALRDVKYLINAEFDLKPHAQAENNVDLVVKYRDQFQRRVEKGQCFHQPSLGCREFYAKFRPPTKSDKSIDYTSDLGLMLFDMKYRQIKDDKNQLKQVSARKVISPDGGFQLKQYHGIGAQPVFFRARVVNGVLTVPAELYREVAQCS